MGNYNGTVHCGHCGKQGHNKRSCPTFTERIRERYADAKETGSPDLEYYARALAKRTGVNPESGEKQGRRYEGYGRKCSYCREQGHSRRTCSSIKDDHRNYRRMAQVIRKDMLSGMREHGFGIGSLLTMVTNEWCQSAGKYEEITQAYLVTAIKWENIGPHNQLGDNCVKTISVKDPSYQPILSIPTEVTGSTENRYNRAPVLVGATPSEKINPPSAWTAGARAEENASIFEKGQTRDDYWFRTYGSTLLDRWAGITPAE
jgi:hypothetical protein